MGSPIAATLMPRGKKVAASPGVQRPTPSPAKPAKGFFDKPARSTPAVREIVCPSAMRVISSGSESHIESALGIYRREKSKLAKTMVAQTSNAKSTRASKRQKVTRESEPGSAGPPSSQSFDRASGDAAGDHQRVSHQVVGKSTPLLTCMAMPLCARLSRLRDCFCLQAPSTLSTCTSTSQIQPQCPGRDLASWWLCCRDDPAVI